MLRSHFMPPRIRARRRDCSLQRLLHRLGGGSFRRRHLTSKLCPLYQPEWRIQTLQLRIPPRKEPQALSKHNLPNQRLRYPSVSARYFSDTIRGEYRRYLLTKVWFRNLGSGTFRINVPWELIAIYLESDTIYENGTYVPKLPLDVEVSWKGEEIDRTPALAEPPASYWIDISEEKPSGEVFVKVSGERAKFITKVYGYVIIPYQSYYPAIGGFPFIFPQHDGYRISIYSYFGNVEVEGEFLWNGSNFTLFKFTTSKGETKELYVKDGRVCYGKWTRRACGRYSLPRGALKLTVGFNRGSLWVWNDGTVYFKTKLDSLGIKSMEFLGGIPSEDIYAVSVYATDRVYEEKDSPLGRVSLALSFIAVVLSLAALLRSRKKG
ncbi:hypothetical protein TK0983 [Thermococcus kodakarensis KOD1]|uniref:Uncharacterized protein n=1 Tax=Thermococcus kodakarensis (strain ATCC BAA-918 / JCM 12380 / KOD1) TaxID=69014 RepID=Q5JID3_THEKO|nr:hypothetical protein TK0983 [Thermococcus kodakarensis KOD1]